MSVARLWTRSSRAHADGRLLLARFYKLACYLLYRAILPSECVLGADLRMLHRGLGVVVHPNTRIGTGVMIAHNVTIASTTEDSTVTIGDRVFLGAGCIIVAPGGRDLVVGDGAVVGAGCIVTTDVPTGARVRPPRPDILPADVGGAGGAQ